MSLPVFIMNLPVLKKILIKMSLQAENSMSLLPFINEFHYDNSGSDVGEFIEIAGLAGTSLSGYSLALYNGNPTQLNVYNTINLSGTFADLGAGYGVLSFAASGLQNGGAGSAGEPDGIALVGPDNSLLQFISYEGVLTAASGPAAGITSVNVGSGVFEDGTRTGTSIGLIGTGTQLSDFTWAIISDDTPGAINAGQTFSGSTGSGAGAFTVGDTSVIEGDSGTRTMVFTVNRTGGSTGAVAVDFATADQTAIAGTDYLGSSGTLNFADGQTVATVSVDISGDTNAEPNETFQLNLSNATGGATIIDAQAIGTITNDDVGLTRIHDVQGAQHISPLVGQSVTIQGIVTAVDSNGFYIQERDINADANIATSEALFVFTSSAPPASVVVGNDLRLTGTVSEFTPGGTSTGNLSTTQLVSPSSYVVISSGNALPTATILGAGGRVLPTANIEDDTPFSGTSTANFDPVNDGMDFYESLEGMLVTVPSPKAVSGTNQFGEIYTVADNGAGATGLSDRGTIVIDPIATGGLGVTNSGPGSDFNPERIQIDADSTITGSDLPAVNVGAVLNDVTGVIGYNFGNFEVIPTSAVTVKTPSTLTQEVTSVVGDADRLTVASFNLLNLDINDSLSETQADQDVADGRFAAIAQIVVNNLGTPDILGLQEIQDNSGGTDNGVVSADQVLQALVDAIVAAGGPQYSFIDNTLIGNNTNGGQPGGNIRNAFLYDSSRVSLVADSVTTTTNPVDQQTSAANPFFGSRLPLVATFSFNDQDVTIVNNHFSSKGGSSPLYGSTQLSLNGSADQRLAQAQNVADYVTGLGPNANVVVLGDLNEFSEEESLAPLHVAGLTDLDATLPQNEQYSYIFDGNAQVLDHVFVSNTLKTGAQFDIVHVNTEFAFTDATASDHDPSVVSLVLPAEKVFTLQLLHFADGEAGLLASQTAKNLAALVDAFEDTHVNSITLAGGDNFIPGPFYAAGADPSITAVLPGGNVQGRVDIAIHNAIGVQASTIGNHEFDFGSQGFADAFRPSGAWVGALFPYLSSNLDFSGDSALNPAYVNTLASAGLEEASANKGKIVPSAVITENGEKIGIVGITTQLIEQISSPTGTEVKGFPTGPGANGEFDNMPLLASQVQVYIDDLRAQGVNKIILMSHLQLINNEKTLAPLLSGVDIILAAGSNTRLGDADDEAAAFPGHAADFADTYPIVTAGSDGKTTVIVNTDNEYTYLGRLVVDFDDNGEIILASLAENLSINGAYAATTQNVAEAWNDLDGDLSDTAFAEGTRGETVDDLTGAVQAVIDAKSSNVYGYSDVYLEGARAKVRFEETNLGNVSADANADAARDALGLAAKDAVVSLKNGGGIRAQIGTVSAPKADGTVDFLPNAGGVVSQLDVENALRFNNALMTFETTAQGLLNILNNPAGLTPGSGGFIQIGGIQFSYDPTLPAGSRVRDIALVNELGEKIAVIANDGVVVAGAPETITMVALNFTANGGDGFAVKANGQNFRYLLADGTVSGLVDEALDFTAAATINTFAGSSANLLTEQRAFEGYFRENFATPDEAFNIVDTPQSGDLRIQNQAARTDTVLSGQFVTYGTEAADAMNGTDGNDLLKGIGGSDTIIGGAGDDIIVGGLGRDRMDGGEGIDTASYADAASGVAVDLSTRKGTYGEAIGDTLSNFENLVGSKYDDALFGNRFDNVLEGGAGNDVLEGILGNDTLIGGEGDDVLLGGKGIDSLTGGAGSDLFVFELGDTGKTLASADTIVDFIVGDDLIDLSAIDAVLATKTVNEAFTFIGTDAFTREAGQLRYEVAGSDVYVTGDFNGDAKADFMLHLKGVTSLSSADFLF